MKIIFLDVDGVLTYDGSGTSDSMGLDVSRIRLLRKIVDETGAKIVLSSSWKHGYSKINGAKREFYKTLERHLAVCGLEIYDITDNIKSEFPDGYSDIEDVDIHCKFGTGRGAEVHRWIQENRPESYVILDDENYDWDLYSMDKNWVQPSWYDPDGGLHPEHVQQAISILQSTK